MTIEFASDAQRACYEKIVPWVKEIFGELAVRERDDAPVVIIFHGSAFVQIAVFPWGDGDAVIQSRSFVVTGAEPTQDLMSYLLHENDNMRFGAFGLDKDNDIFFEYAIVGSTVDREELKAAAAAVALTADQYDDKIVERFGGQRAIDRAG
jgi:hypothetical protein